MGTKVPPRRRRRKGKKQDRLTKAERRARLLERQDVWLQQFVAFAEAFVTGLLQPEIVGLLGRPAGRWGDRTAPVDAACHRCQRAGRGWFRRNGTYPRTLLLPEVVLDLRVPRLRWACGGTVDVSFSAFAPYERVSPELAQRLRELVALSLTLRQVGAVTAPANGGPLAKSPVNARVGEVARLAAGFHQGPLDRIPPVVLLDGLGVKLMEPTGDRFVDQQGRERPRMRRKQVVLLVAYGGDPTTGEWGVLDWERAAQEDQASWERLLSRLRERGVTAERGLRLVVSDGSEGLAAALGMVDLGPAMRHQRWVFHKLRNIGKAVQAAEAKTREEKRAARRQVVEEAAAVYDGADRVAIERRAAAFVTKWQGSEPKAVATLRRDFEETLVYLEVQAAAAERGEAWDRKYLRTTSALERLNRHNLPHTTPANGHFTYAGSRALAEVRLAGWPVAWSREAWRGWLADECPGPWPAFSLLARPANSASTPSGQVCSSRTPAAIEGKPASAISVTVAFRRTLNASGAWPV